MLLGRLVFVAVLSLLGFVLLRWLWPGLVKGGRKWVYLALVVLSLAAYLLPRALGLGAHGEIPFIGEPLKLLSTVWGVTVLIMVVAGLPVVFLRWVRERRRVDPPEGADVSLERRDLLVNAGRAVPLLALGTSAAGVVNGMSGFVVREVEVRMRNLPPALEGFRIGQITDVHVGPFITPEYLRGAVEAMNAAGAHVQVMTGDLIDDLTQLDETMEALAGCRAPHGMLAVLGNHEHFRGLNAVLRGYASLQKRGAPVRLLVDSAHVFEHEGQRVRVVGVDYPLGRGMGARTSLMQASAEKAFQGTSPEELVLCLTHHPSFFPYAVERGARLTLAGHTHGGQVAFFGMPLFWFVFEFMFGGYRRKDGYLYVSGGTGHWLPFRLGIPPEVTVLTLRGT
ncbi:metallophosphoesterase [Stigmatella aurantiaca]|uniref:Metallophosphoesterase n=1 Tax=Stigmatella aurantiaca (strain DW4/3-1) TaxID=378806 RepID=E3FCK5_STIAD|nr:metallophosphoesterase [Stigmatella aurantiaca]ADO71314.1 Metallophosphoesterase [Stigmatella aurantiaca DW4/3-1]